MSASWDKEVDVLVVGSGAGGMLSALVAARNHADELIIEKEKLWGGTSATSGAGIGPGAAPGARIGRTSNGIRVRPGTGIRRRTLDRGRYVGSVRLIARDTALTRAARDLSH